MKLLTAAIVITCSCIFLSCNKEDSKPQDAAANLKGSYTLISNHSKTITESIVNNGGNTMRNVTTMEYDTKDNTGDIVIDDSKFSYTNLGYTIDAIAHTLQYENGNLESTFDFPFYLAMTRESGNAPYKIVSADSIYFSSGSFILDGSTQASLPSGAKIKFEGDKLIITQSVHHENTNNSGGEQVTAIADGVAVVTFQKK